MVGRRTEQKHKALSWLWSQTPSPVVPQPNSATSVLWPGVWHPQPFIRVRWQWHMRALASKHPEIGNKVQLPALCCTSPEWDQSSGGHVTELPWLQGVVPRPCLPLCPIGGDRAPCRTSWPEVGHLSLQGSYVRWRDQVDECKHMCYHLPTLPSRQSEVYHCESFFPGGLGRRTAFGFPANGNSKPTGLSPEGCRPRPRFPGNGQLTLSDKWPLLTSGQLSFKTTVPLTKRKLPL